MLDICMYYIKNTMYDFTYYYHNCIITTTTTFFFSRFNIISLVLYHIIHIIIHAYLSVYIKYVKYKKKINRLKPILNKFNSICNIFDACKDFKIYKYSLIIINKQLVFF